MPSPIVITARHFAKRAPSPRYSSQPLAQPVEALGHLLAGRAGEVLGAVSTLIPGMIPLVGEVLGERRAVGRGLAHRLVVEDHAADVLLEPRRREEHVAVGPPVLLGRLERRSSRTASRSSPSSRRRRGSPCRRRRAPRRSRSVQLPLMAAIAVSFHQSSDLLGRVVGGDPTHGARAGAHHDRLGLDAGAADAHAAEEERRS